MSAASACFCLSAFAINSPLIPRNCTVSLWRALTPALSAGAVPSSAFSSSLCHFTLPNNSLFSDHHRHPLTCYRLIPATAYAPSTLLGTEASPETWKSGSLFVFSAGSGVVLRYEQSPSLRLLPRHSVCRAERRISRRPAKPKEPLQRRGEQMYYKCGQGRVRGSALKHLLILGLSRGHYTCQIRLLQTPSRRPRRLQRRRPPSSNKRTAKPSLLQSCWLVCRSTIG